MNREEIQALFCCKIYRECVKFKEQQLELSKEEIFANAYKIDAVINIYEALVESSQRLEVEAMKNLLFYPNLLAYFYDGWLKIEDSQYEEMSQFLKRSLRDILLRQEVAA